MDYIEIQHHLTDEIMRLKEVRDKLSGSGEPLSKSDKETITHALAGTWLRRLQNELNYLFANGYVESANSACKKTILDTLALLQ